MLPVFRQLVEDHGWYWSVSTGYKSWSQVALENQYSEMEFVGTCGIRVSGAPGHQPCPPYTCFYALPPCTCFNPLAPTSLPALLPAGLLSLSAAVTFASFAPFVTFASFKAWWIEDSRIKHPSLRGATLQITNQELPPHLLTVIQR